MFRWRSDPSDWPAGVLLGAAGLCALPPPALAVADQGAAAAAWAVTGVAAWCVLGARTRPGFPFLFDALGLQVFLWSACVLLWAAARWMRA